MLSSIISTDNWVVGRSSACSHYKVKKNHFDIKHNLATRCLLPVKVSVQAEAASGAAALASSVNAGPTMLNVSKSNLSQQISAIHIIQ